MRSFLHNENKQRPPYIADAEDNNDTYEEKTFIYPYTKKRFN